ncbi:MAG TPA: hypothetical protein VIT65_11470 [Microlunatus sp.]
MTSAAEAVLDERVRVERVRQARLETLRTTGPAAELVAKLAGDRLNAAESDLRVLVDKAGTPVPAVQFRHRVTRVVDVQAAADRVGTEALALAVGVLARHFALDANACAQADDLIAWLAGKIDRRYRRPTVPGGEDALHRGADIIRRRVPDYGDWDLPIMAHELGHVVAAGLRPWDARADQILRPVEDWLSRFDGARRQQAGELFSDVFATYVLGPSYPCAMIVHRLNPQAAATADTRASHPGDASRAHACLWTLKQMRGGGELHAYDDIILKLTSLWSDLQTDADQRARLSAEDQQQLINDLGGCWAAMTSHLSALAYQWSGRVFELMDRLTEITNTDPENGTPADVLNAAWLAKVDALLGRGRPVVEALFTTLLTSALKRSVPAT